MLPGVLGLAALASLLVMRVPVALAVGAVAALGLVMTEFMLGAGLSETGAEMSRMLLQLFHADTVAMVVLFVLLGNLAFYAGISTRIYDAAAVWLRRVPGGMAMAAVMGCGGFAAISGSSVGCAATMGRICVPEMLQQGYDARLATSSVAVGGTLGSLIPPSLLFIFFGLLTDMPVGELFIAGILPGLLSLAGMLLVIVWWIIDEPGIAPGTAPDGASRAQATMALWPPLLLLAVIVGGLYTGLTTPGMAAGICVALVLLIGGAQRRLTAENLWIALRESAVQSLTILALIAVARIFMGFIDLTGIGAAVADRALAADLTAWTVIAIVAIAYLILGMFIEPLGILVLTLPVMLPLTQAYGMDLIWFGVIVVKLMEIALITPPVGLNVFVIGSVTRTIAMDRIFAGVARFLMVDVLVLVVLILFPVVSTLLPDAMTL